MDEKLLGELIGVLRSILVATMLTALSAWVSLAVLLFR